MKPHKPKPATTQTICNAAMRAHYQARTDIYAEPARAGATNALSLPSRIGNRLHYRDGSVVTLDAAA